jgi:quercetin 2,3-dioxygenase
VLFAPAGIISKGMITPRKSEDRGHFDHGWLNTYHTFSFADYQDPNYHSFRTLRVINEDTVAAGQGFGTHPHRDMEIITYITRGALAHKDSMGNGSTIQTGDVQRMSAGSGVTHSEFNASSDEPCHLLQIWLFPNKKGIPPEYEQKHFPLEKKRGKLCLIVSPDGDQGSLQFHQEARIYATVLEKGEEIKYPFEKNRAGWLQVVSGEAELNGIQLSAGDGAKIENETQITLRSLGKMEALLFDFA